MHEDTQKRQDLASDLPVQTPLERMVENGGVGPDREVDFDPKAVRAGQATQSDEAFEWVVAENQESR